MPRIRKFNSRHRIKGNQHTKTPNSDNVNTPTCARPRPTANLSSSSKKIKNSSLPKGFVSSDNNVNMIVNIELISSFIQLNSKYKQCDQTNSLELNVDHDFRSGLAHRLILKCNYCKFQASTITSRAILNTYEVNTRYIYALRSIGKGLEAGKLFSSVMNMAPPCTRSKKYTKSLLRAATEVCGASTRNAAVEAIRENDGNGDVAACFDGTWQKRGHTSLNGVVTVTAFDTGKVLDFECLSKFCTACVQKSNTPRLKQLLHKESGLCSCNYVGSSGGMEVAGAKALCSRSVEKLGLRYTRYLGDGDSKGFAAVLEDKPYGNDVPITKLECVGHVQKRVGTRLRRLKTNSKKIKLADGKPLGGKGRLTNVEIDQLQNYYGMAIRNNVHDVGAMRKAIWAIYFHRSSTDDKPRHELCPPGPESWCKYNKAKALNTNYKHDHVVPEPVMRAIQPVFRDLSKRELLEKCTHGKTQNQNESFNSTIWQRIPKTVFVGLETLKLGVTDAVICFNDGSSAKCNVLERLGINPGKFMIDGLQKYDAQRIRKAEIEAQEQNKKKRKIRRLTKRKKEDQEEAEEEVYCKGGF